MKILKDKSAVVAFTLLCITITIVISVLSRTISYSQGTEVTELSTKTPIVSSISNTQKIELADLRAKGFTAYNKGNYQLALNYLQQALVIAQEIGDRESEGNTLNNIGEVYNAQGNYKQAVNYHQQALVILEEVEDWEGKGAALNSL